MDKKTVTVRIEEVRVSKIVYELGGNIKTEEDVLRHAGEHYENYGTGDDYTVEEVFIGIDRPWEDREKQGFYPVDVEKTIEITEYCERSRDIRDMADALKTAKDIFDRQYFEEMCYDNAVIAPLYEITEYEKDKYKITITKSYSFREMINADSMEDAMEKASVMYRDIKSGNDKITYKLTPVTE